MAQVNENNELIENIEIIKTDPTLYKMQNGECV